MVEDGLGCHSVSFFESKYHRENGCNHSLSVRKMGLIFQRNTNPKGFPHYFLNRIDPSPLNHLSCQAPDPLNVRARGAGGAGGGGGGGGAAQVRMQFYCSFALLAAIFCLRFGVFNVGGFYKRKLTEVLDSIWIIEMLPSSN